MKLYREEIATLKSQLQVSDDSLYEKTEELKEVQEELKNVRNMNDRWQELNQSKCDTISSM